MNVIQKIKQYVNIVDINIVRNASCIKKRPKIFTREKVNVKTVKTGKLNEAVKVRVAGEKMIPNNKEGCTKKNTDIVKKEYLEIKKNLIKRKEYLDNKVINIRKGINFFKKSESK